MRVQETSQPLKSGCCLPVTIRWNVGQVNERMTVPLESTLSKNADAEVSKLVAATQPASFGF